MLAPFAAVALVLAAAPAARADIGMGQPQFSIIRQPFMFVPQTTVVHQYKNRFMDAPMQVAPLIPQLVYVQQPLVQEQLVHDPIGLNVLSMPFNSFTSDPKKPAPTRRNASIADWSLGGGGGSGGSASGGTSPAGAFAAPQSGRAAAAPRRKSLGW